MCYLMYVCLIVSVGLVRACVTPKTFLFLFSVSLEGWDQLVSV